ncbi:hypothetical protein ACA910_022309 [Epithemia clementina (nom. ined.)]
MENQKGSTSDIPESLDAGAHGESPATNRNVPQQPHPLGGKVRKDPPKNDEPPLDDLELMLLHEDFPKLLELSTHVKGLRNALVNAPRSRRAVSSELSPEQIHAALGRMKDSLVTFPENRHRSVKRGTHAITDITIDDSISTLQREYEHLRKWMAECDQYRSESAAASSPKRKRKGRAKKSDDESDDETGNGVPLALKYSKWQTDLLMDWIVQHIDQPFPDQCEIQYLVRETGLSPHQVINWTTNVRKRNRKATCEAGKKPHHFIDFMFLLQDREDRQKLHDDELLVASNSSHAQYESNNDNIYQLDQLEQERSAPDSSCERQQFDDSRTTPTFTSLQKLDSRNEIDYDDENDDDPLAFDGEFLNEDLLQDFADLWLRPEGESDILPSVTEDSHDGPGTTSDEEVTNSEHDDGKRNRDPSFDLGDAMKEDIHSWAAELGLSIEI